MNALTDMAIHLSSRAAAEVPRGTGRPPSLRIGDRFGDWIVIGYVPGHGDSKDVARVKAAWRCRCTCGTERAVMAQALNNGRSRSCGHDTGGRPVGGAT